MTEKKITITGSDGNDLLITDPIKGYQGRIHRSLIEDNRIEIVNNEITVSENLHYHWFEKDIKEEKARDFKERCDLFYPHIPLFWEKRDIILQEPRFYSIKSPDIFCGGYLIGGSQITLGEMLKLYQYEPVFSVQCECGGRAFIYYFTGSPLSGSLYRVSYICLRCERGQRMSDYSSKCAETPKGYTFRTLFHPRNKYRPLKPIAQNPASIKNLIDFLEGRTNIIEGAEQEELQHTPSDNITVSIGGKPMPNQTFASIIGSDNAEMVDVKDEKKVH